MDPAILLESFSPVDMDMWHTYNTFLNDENLSNLKAEGGENHSDSSSSSNSNDIKEENIGNFKKSYYFQ